MHPTELIAGSRRESLGQRLPGGGRGRRKRRLVEGREGEGCVEGSEDGGGGAGVGHPPRTLSIGRRTPQQSAARRE